MPYQKESVIHMMLVLAMINLHTKYEVSVFTYCEDTTGNAKCKNWGSFGELGDTQGSRSPSDKLHMTSYSTFVETMHLYTHTHTHTHTTVLLLFWNLSGTTQVSRYQKGKTRKVKTNLDLLEQEIVSGSGIY